MVTTTAGIAARIHKEIEAHNEQAATDNKWSILSLSERSGVSRSTLNRKMADEDQFTLKELVKISAALGLEPHELAGLYFTRTAVSA